MAGYKFSAALVFTLVILCLYGPAYCQLITPTQACEMGCLQDVAKYTTDESKQAFQDACRAFCMKHAYDDLLHQAAS